MRVFFDTEFTGLSSDPRLLSIGLVADNGEEPYIEFSNGWSEADCSTWVREHVMSILGRGERLTRRDTAKRILAWLSSFGVPTTVLGDTDWDTTLLADLMHECDIAPECFRIEVLTYSGGAQVIAFEQARQDYFESHQVTPHHALTDARAFHVAWHSTFGQQDENR